MVRYPEKRPVPSILFHLQGVCQIVGIDISSHRQRDDALFASHEWKFSQRFKLCAIRCKSLRSRRHCGSLPDGDKLCHDLGGFRSPLTGCCVGLRCSEFVGCTPQSLELKLTPAHSLGSLSASLVRGNGALRFSLLLADGGKVLANDPRQPLKVVHGARH